MKNNLKPLNHDEESAINDGIQQDSDHPEWSENNFSRLRPAHEALPAIIGKKNADYLLNKSPGRPPKENPKRRITIRLDADLVDWIKDKGPGYQTRINSILRNAMEQQ